MTDPTNKVAEQTDWRVDQRESRRGYQHHDTVKKWAAILNFIVLYQNRHGFAPMNHVIGKETNLSVGQVQYHMGKMHEQCLIHDHGNTHPRMIDLLASGKLLTGQVKREDVSPSEAAEYETLVATSEGEEPIVEAAKEDKKMPSKSIPLHEAMPSIAEYIDGYIKDFGEPPTGVAVAKHMGQSEAATARVIMKMVALGYIDKPKRSQKNWLTGLGRAKLLNRGGVGTQMPVEPKAPEKPTETRDSGRVVRSPRAHDRAPMRPPRAATKADLSDVETLDLIVELNSRGYRINL